MPSIENPGENAGKSSSKNPAPNSSKALPKILIIQTGTAGPLVEAYGDYPDWFRRSLNADAEQLPVLRAHAGDRLSAESIFAHGAQGIIVTGSPLSVTSHEAWMDELGGELMRAAGRGVPILGVCFGHQLLCQNAGVEVIENPRGREIGTVEVQLSEAGRRDPLFAWARDEGAGARGNDARANGNEVDSKASRIAVQATHVDAVYPVPKGAVLLASNENTPVQAVRFSETVASVQFHPEIEPQMLRDLIASRREILGRENLDADALIAAVHETQSGQILRAFADQVRHA